MGFQQGLSGLSSASKQLDVVGNNVANASTVGFKSSRAEFADLYATNFYGVTSTQAGIGSTTQSVTQGMTQGNVTSTGRNLDLAINNNGFFALKQTAESGGSGSSGALLYTRNGQFQVDRDGYIVNGSDRLQGWMAKDGVITQGAVTDLKLDTNGISPKPSSKVNMGINLNSSENPPSISPLDPTNTDTFNWSNSTTVYDSLGNSHNLTLYYVKGSPSSSGTSWNVSSYVDGVSTGNSYTMNFDTTGKLTNTTPFAVTYSAAAANGATVPMSFNVDYTGSLQVAQQSSTNSVTSDGYAAGTLRSINIDRAGKISATFTNGQTNSVGQVALANFTNQQGLQSVGNNRWQQAYAAGSVSYNVPGAGTAGTIQSSSLEDSNVDLTSELVGMITAQRFYQANAQTIKTQDTILQTLLNLR